MVRQVIAVIGGGFSGTLTALNLLRESLPETCIVVIERRDRCGPGQAYSTTNPSHLLNVRAARMSAFEDDPSHFLDWWRADTGARGEPLPSGSCFAPRHLYGTYLSQLLQGATTREPERLRILHDNVTDIAPSAHGARLLLASGTVLDAAIAVVATGNHLPLPPPIANVSFYDSAFYERDPWQPDIASGLDPESEVLLIGAGLTMVDTVLSLLDAGHRGVIHAISRRGLVPHCHLPASSHHASVDRDLPTSPVALLRLVRQSARERVRQGGTWHIAVDQLRPVTQTVWQSMSQAQRSSFLRHLRPWWDIHRHRMAPSIGDRINLARASGQLRIAAGRLRNCVITPDGVEATYLPRGAAHEVSLTVARVINCTGPTGAHQPESDRLAATMLRSGTVRPDPNHVALDVTGRCQARDGHGRITRNLFCVGPPTRGAFWEITAVPDIRRQCQALAHEIAGQVRGSSSMTPDDPLPLPQPPQCRRETSKLTASDAGSLPQ